MLCCAHGTQTWSCPCRRRRERGLSGRRVEVPVRGGDFKSIFEEKILYRNASAEESLCEAVSSFLGGDMGLLGGSVLSLASGGIWGRGGLLRLMRGIPLEKLHGRGSPAVYATCSAVYPPLGTRHFRLNGFDVRAMRKILLATSAIPLAFRPEKIGGALYCDGGISCNVPLAPLVREKCTDAIVVHLSQTGRISGDAPGSMRVLEIRPSVPLARRGVLDFSCGRIEKLIRLGYDDCKKALSGRLGRFLP